ncbi:DNA recombination protein RmuC [bacterium]|jgi:DNA recombination protein RmuC|nr:DNA recombination protein RmuC [bacterium]
MGIGTSILSLVIVAVCGAGGFFLARFFLRSDAKKQDEQQATILELNRKLVEAQSSHIHLQDRLKEQRIFMEDFQKQTRNEFEVLANRIFDSKSKSFSEQAEKNMEGILKPLKEKIHTFEKKVEDTYHQETRERTALKVEMDRLIQLNERMSQEANQLTQALKGDSKVQGDWGELVLERILEASGLREGFEYTTQREHLDEDGSRFKPDVIINLPDTKHIIVDSKVSLKAYELYFRAETPEEKSLHLAAHLKSIMNHVDQLSEKHYAKLKGIRSPEFVFLFMPIEPAYLQAIQTDTELATKAWKKGVAIVTSSTLFTSLKTVASIWRLENQNKNALEIASEGAKLYDKFVGFLEDFEKLGKTFQQGSDQYGQAMNKLKEGPGNVFRKIERLKELGAAPNKSIRPELLE